MIPSIKSAQTIYGWMTAEHPEYGFTYKSVKNNEVFAGYKKSVKMVHGYPISSNVKPLIA